MNKIFTLVLICVITLAAHPQQTLPVTFGEEPYGKVTMADLELPLCDFEKDANAEVLFDVYNSVELKRHVRIKVFNDFGKNQANIRLLNTAVSALKAETINLENGKIVISPVDSKDIYKQNLNKYNTITTFTMPNVKAGSIIEYEFTSKIPKMWYFQGSIPTRYSELNVLFPGTLELRIIPHITQPYVKNVGDATDKYQVKALANVPSLPNEPYMSSRLGSLQRMELLNMSFLSINTWTKIADELLSAPYFTSEFDKNLTNEKPIIARAKKLATEDDKIAYVFDTVRNRMACSNQSAMFTDIEVSKAWDSNTGNASEINVILYNLLHKSGVNAKLMMVGSKDKDRINPYNANLELVSGFMVYVPIDSTGFYLLDASNNTIYTM